jgi:hypothetical protein
MSMKHHLLNLKSNGTKVKEMKSLDKHSESLSKAVSDSRPDGSRQISSRSELHIIDLIFKDKWKYAEEDRQAGGKKYRSLNEIKKHSGKFSD